MKVYNLTDVSTPHLEQRKLVNQHIAIGDRLANPGEFVEVADTPELRASLEYLLQVGAVSIDGMPPPYVQARSAKTESGPGRAPARHVDVRETAVTEPPAPTEPADGVKAVLEKHDPAGASDKPADKPKNKPRS